MATIKDVAKAAGFSTTTTSLVLSGKPGGDRISDKTREKILDTAARLGYRANVAARRLKANQSSGLMVSAFMALDTRAYGMMRFLLGLQAAIECCKQPIELVIHSYKSGTLHTYMDSLELTGCAIICNANEDDLAFLHRAHISVPIVLYLRDSDKFSTVNINHALIGETAAEIFARRGHKHALILGSERYFINMDIWTGSFAERARFLGLAVDKIDGINSTKGGYSGGLKLCKMSSLPDCVFVESNAMAIGLLRALAEYNIQVPQQLEIISIGIDIADFEAFTNVSVSTIYVPIEELAAKALGILLNMVSTGNNGPERVQLPTTYKCRESCGE